MTEFKGCHHCGDLKHGVKDCPTYKDWLDKDGRRKPGYSSALDKFLHEKAIAVYGAKGSPVHSLTGHDEDDRHDLESNGGTDSDFTSDGEMSSATAKLHCQIWKEVRDKKIPALSSDTPAADILPSTPSIRHKIKKAFSIHTKADIKALAKWMCAMQKAAKNQTPPPLPKIKNKIWAMIDSGSEPTIANCSRVFPKHPIKQSEAQKRGVRYVSATGNTVENKGEVDITHRDPDICDFHFTFQHADVHCPIISVKYLVGLKCKVLFSDDGGCYQIP